MPQPSTSGVPADRRAKLKLLAAGALPVWGRAVLVILGVVVLVDAVGLSTESGYAVLPGIYLVMSPPACRHRRGRTGHSPSFRWRGWRWR
jgi:hypothetical protein